MPENSSKLGNSNWLLFWGTILAAIIGGIAIVIADSDDPAATPVRAPSPTEAETGGEGDGGEAPAGDSDSTAVDGGSTKTEAPTVPPRQTVRTGDGGSRMEPKLLKPNRWRNESIDSGNDVDWFVYEVTEDQTATIEIIKGANPPDREAAGVAVDIWEENTKIEDTGAWPDEPLTYPHGATRGVPLYIEVVDECETGCSMGPYSIIVRSAPPG